jgi:hypothetical protein
MTAMPPTPFEEALAERLRGIFAGSAVLPPEVRRFIDSTFSNPSDDELAVILADDSNPERDCLLELLFSPDESVRLELEEFLAGHPSEAVDAGRVAEILCRPTLAVAFGRPGGGGLAVAMTPALAFRFVRQLKIDRPIPPPIAAAIDSRTTGTDRLRLRVLARSARFDFSPAKLEFLCRLIAQADLRDEAGCDCFAFALELLAEIGPEADIGRTLARRKKQLFSALARARRQRDELASANFETLASRSLRLAWVDEAAARRQITHIDRIGLAVFGRIAHVEADGPGDVFALSLPRDITDLLRRLG